MAQQLAKQEETRQKFISDISHEFQTPLTAIQGFANILKEEDLPRKQREKYADIVLFHSKRLSTLSKNMLQLTLLENEEARLEITNYSVTDQLSRVISTQENQADAKDIEIVFMKPKKDIFIDGDEHRLEQVWINVINNAIKYTEIGGLITVHVKKYSKEVEVMVEDTGRGMSKEVISHIFERFYREDKARSIEGNGLGLSIVKTIVDLHGGKIDVISQVDVGTTFVIKIPVERSFNLKDRLLNK
jgi:signal transduction histidine kinase